MAEYTGFNDCDDIEIWSDSIVESNVKGTSLPEEYKIVKNSEEYGVNYGGMFISLLSHATNYEVGTCNPFVVKEIPSLMVMEQHATD